MKRSLIAVAGASMLLASVGFALADGEAAVPWVPNQGTVMTEYSTTRHYTSFVDPSMHPIVGMELPGTVTVYELPDTMNVPSSTNYRYGLINNHPVVIETTTRKIVHTWD
jgi:hypothetical protein